MYLGQRDAEIGSSLVLVTYCSYRQGQLSRSRSWQYSLSTTTQMSKSPKWVNPASGLVARDYRGWGETGSDMWAYFENNGFRAEFYININLI